MWNPVMRKRNRILSFIPMLISLGSSCLCPVGWKIIAVQKLLPDVLCMPFYLLESNFYFVIVREGSQLIWLLYKRPADFRPQALIY